MRCLSILAALLALAACTAPTAPEPPTRQLAPRPIRFADSTLCSDCRPLPTVDIPLVRR
jgi:hypothetical protein